MYPRAAPRAPPGGIGDPAAAAVRRKRHWSRPMPELVHPSGFQPCAAENRSKTTQIDTHNRLTPSPPPANRVTNVTDTQHHPHSARNKTSREQISPDMHLKPRDAGPRRATPRQHHLWRLHDRSARSVHRPNVGPATHPGPPHGGSSVAFLKTATPSTKGKLKLLACRKAELQNATNPAKRSTGFRAQVDRIDDPTTNLPLPTLPTFTTNPHANPDTSSTPQLSDIHTTNPLAIVSSTLSYPLGDGPRPTRS